MIRNCWYALGFAHEFPPATLSGHTVAGRPMVAWRDGDGAVTALDGRCVHKRFPLREGRLLADGTLECGYHGFRYNSEGRCVGVPALQERPEHIPRVACLHRYPVVEQDGLVWVWPGEVAASVSVRPPSPPEIADPVWETRYTEPMHVAASAQLLIENLLDLTHFYPLHAGNIGTYADAAVAVEIHREVEDGHRTLTTTRRRSDFTFGPTKQDWFDAERGDNVAVHRMVGPALFRVVEAGAPTGRLGTDAERKFVLHQTITPVTESALVWRRAVSCRRVADTAGERPPLADRIMAGCTEVIEQDRWALERQQEMFAYPDDDYREVHIRTDGAVVIARHIIDEMEEAETATARKPAASRAR